jgi:hypothetical protein
LRRSPLLGLNHTKAHTVFNDFDYYLARYQASLQAELRTVHEFAADPVATDEIPVSAGLALADVRVAAPDAVPADVQAAAAGAVPVDVQAAAAGAVPVDVQAAAPDAVPVDVRVAAAGAVPVDVRVAAAGAALKWFWDDARSIPLSPLP